MSAPAAVADVFTEDELTRGNVLVRFVDLGEGFNGEYDPDDLDDQELLRFDVMRRGTRDFEFVDDGSYCTHTPVSTSRADRRALLLELMNAVYDLVVSGESVRTVCQHASWMDVGWTA